MIQAHRFNLDAATDPFPFHVDGFGVRWWRSNRAEVVVKVHTDVHDLRQAVILANGAAIEMPYGRLYLSWDAQEGAWVELLTYGPGDAALPRMMGHDANNVTDFARGDRLAPGADWTFERGNLYSTSTSYSTCYTVPADKVFSVSYVEMSGNANHQYPGRFRLADADDVIQWQEERIGKGSSEHGFLHRMIVPAGWYFEGAAMNASHPIALRVGGWLSP